MPGPFTQPTQPTGIIFRQKVGIGAGHDHPHVIQLINSNENTVCAVDDAATNTRYMKCANGMLDSFYLNTFLNVNNKMFIVLSGKTDITYDYNPVDDASRDEKNRITNYIDSIDNPDLYDYEELDNKFVVHITAEPSANNTWIDVKRDWMTTSMNVEVAIPKQEAAETFFIAIKRNETYTAKYCNLDANTSIVLDTTSEKMIIPFNLPRNKQFKINEDRYIFDIINNPEYTGRIEIKNLTTNTVIFVVAEKC